ncbi:MAG: YdcF family protein [Defluviitaleaceae bacterium]|nr:YdcF family protein [Defluviitaleaceae bacterium]
MTEFIFVCDRPEPTDIILLPGGSPPEIPARAAALYREGYAPLVLPSGKYGINAGRFSVKKYESGSFGIKKIDAKLIEGRYETECEFFTDVLLESGVPPSAVVPEARATYTKQNAEFSRLAADARGLEIKSALLCCKSFHARRCLTYYQLAFPEAKILVAPVDVYGVTRDGWFRCAYGVERVMGELARCGQQFKDDLLNPIKEYTGV